MISDVLADAIAEIRRYQADYPEAYGEQHVAQWINGVVKRMEGLRIMLDTPPKPSRRAMRRAAEKLAESQGE